MLTEYRKKSKQHSKFIEEKIRHFQLDNQELDLDIHALKLQLSMLKEYHQLQCRHSLIYSTPEHY